MKKLVGPICSALIIIPLLHSCGKSSPGGGIQEEEVDESIDGSTIDGQYMAKFTTLNPHVNGTLPGSLTFFRKEDKLMTFVRLFAGKPRTWHQQGVYMGRRCPTFSDDTNADGYIDIDEAMKVVGKMIIPLDGNINSQSAGRNLYPVSDLSGYYHYERVGSFKRMFNDLHGEDLDQEDHITKLAEDQPFSFERRVVLVQGVDEETVLPESVAGLGLRKNFQTLPITCGIIRKITVAPGAPNTDTIPGPVAEVEEGQDRPAPAEEESPDTGGTVAGTTGSNETGDGEVGDPSGASGGTTAGTTGRTTGGSTGGSTGSTTTGGFIGGFIGGSQGGSSGSTSGGSTGGTSGGTTGGESGGTSGGTTGGFIGGFIGGFTGGASAN